MEDEEVYINFKNGQSPYMSDTQLNQLQKLIKADIKSKLELIFPIGSTYVTQTNENPSTILGFGTWERFKGMVAVGLDENDADFNTIGKTGGEKTHILTIGEMPNHNHADFVSNGQGNGSWGYMFEYNNNSAGQNAGASGYTGGGQAHNNLQPYKVVGYMWIRTA